MSSQQSDNQSPDPNWPQGISSPDLTIAAGQVVRLSSWETFGTLTIEAGGVLELIQDGWAAFCIGCTGNLNVRGTIKLRNGSASPMPWDNIPFPTADGHVILLRSQKWGGAGGNSINGWQPAKDSDFPTGNGGGGQGCGTVSAHGSSPSGNQGGAGGAGGASGGQGAQLYGQAGGNGQTYGRLPSGGGGGSRGRHGGSVYLKALGNVDLVGGMIDASGEDGGSGGAASDYNDPHYAPVASGGGGGAGGNGGIVHIAYGGTFLPGDFNVDSGRGGAGGPGTRNTAGASGQPGQDGSTGEFWTVFRPAGSVSIERGGPK